MYRTARTHYRLAFLFLLLASGGRRWAAHLYFLMIVPARILGLFSFSSRSCEKASISPLLSYQLWQDGNLGWLLYPYFCALR